MTFMIIVILCLSNKKLEGRRYKYFFKIFEKIEFTYPSYRVGWYDYRATHTYLINSVINFILNSNIEKEQIIDYL